MPPLKCYLPGGSASGGGAVAEVADVRPQLGPGGALVRRQPTQRQRVPNGGRQFLVHEPALQLLVDEGPVRVSELSQRGQAGAQEAEGLLAVGRPLGRRRGVRPQAVGAAQRAAGGAVVDKKRS